MNRTVAHLVQPCQIQQVRILARIRHRHQPVQVEPARRTQPAPASLIPEDVMEHIPPVLADGVPLRHHVAGAAIMVLNHTAHVM